MLSIIIPVYNEEGAILETINETRKTLRGFVEYEIIVVNDGSTDSSTDKIKLADTADLKIIDHIDNLGYGKSLYDGILAAKYNYIGILDADGTYPIGELKTLYRYLPQYDMAVGARTGKEFKKGIVRRFFNFLAEYACGRKMADVNSGFRIFKKDIVLNFKDSLCLGFSFTTTLSIVFFLNQYYVKYIPITYCKRKGKSKINRFRDTLRAAQIIVETILHYNPLKLFLLIAFLNFMMGLTLAIINFLFLKAGAMDIVSGLLIASFLPIFCIGLIAVQLKKIYQIIKTGKTI